MTEHDPEFPYVIKDFSGHVFVKFAKKERNLADWFAKNHPHYNEVIDTTPKSPAEIAFDAIEIGQHFGFYADGENPTRFPYTKVSKTTYEARYPEPWHGGTKTFKPESTYLPFAEPKPTFRDQFDALPVGTVFTWGSKIANAVKLSNDRVFYMASVNFVDDVMDPESNATLEVIPVD